MVEMVELSICTYTLLCMKTGVCYLQLLKRQTPVFITTAVYDILSSCPQLPRYVDTKEIVMLKTIEIPVTLAHFRLPDAVQERLQYLLDRQDSGKMLTPKERREAEGLVQLADFFSLLNLRATRIDIEN